MKLGDIIQEIDIRNNFNKLSLSSVRGVSIDKKFILTKANMEGVNLSGYKIVEHFCICYVPVTSRNGEKISLALNDANEDYIVSSTYVVLKNKNDKLIYMPFLDIYMRRSEFDRLSRFNSWGSARETLNTSELYEFKILLPSNIKIQHQYADAYNALKKLAEQNEAMVKPLLDFCTGFMAKLLVIYKSINIGNLIEECEEVNGSKYNVDRVIGLSTSKKLIPTKANMKGVNIRGYKLLKKNSIAYVSDTSRRGDKVSMGYNYSDDDYLVSSITTIFKSKDETILNTNFLYLYLCRESFDRYARYNSWGSARETFDWSEMCRVKIPLPPIEVQESIVAIYKCAEKARSIAERAREEMKRICPAMVQRAAHQ